MANLYGVANPNPPPVQGGMIGAVDIACPAGVETNVIAINVAPATSQGWYYPVVWFLLPVSLGATPATGLSINSRIGAGSDFGIIQVNTLLLTASATLLLTYMSPGPTVLVSNPFTVTVFNLSVSPIAQAVTARAQGAQAWGQWLRAPDQ